MTDLERYSKTPLSPFIKQLQDGVLQLWECRDEDLKQALRDGNLLPTEWRQRITQELRERLLDVASLDVPRVLHEVLTSSRSKNQDKLEAARLLLDNASKPEEANSKAEYQVILSSVVVDSTMKPVEDKQVSLVACDDSEKPDVEKFN